MQASGSVYSAGATGLTSASKIAPDPESGCGGIEVIVEKAEAAHSAGTRVG